MQLFEVNRTTVWRALNYRGESALYPKIRAAAIEMGGQLVGVPELQTTLALTLILSLLNAFKVFREAYLVAGRYPQQSIYLLQHLFNNWFLSLDLPRLAAAAVLVALVLLVVILGLLKWWDHCAKDE